MAPLYTLESKTREWVPQLPQIKSQKTHTQFMGFTEIAMSLIAMGGRIVGHVVALHR